ncbi:MAG TPA: hypothetical protein VGK87_07005, partial [Anaerolineae bacterium]
LSSATRPSGVGGASGVSGADTKPDVVLLPAAGTRFANGITAAAVTSPPAILNTSRRLRLLLIILLPYLRIG